jgi:hypothetical protein
MSAISGGGVEVDRVGWVERQRNPSLSAPRLMRIATLHCRGFIGRYRSSERPIAGVDVYHIIGQYTLPRSGPCAPGSRSITR